MTILLVLSLRLQDPTIDALIEQLGNDRIEDRAKAAAALRQAGEEAIPALRRARRSSDLELRGRANELLTARGIQVVALRSCDPKELATLLRDLFEGIEGLNIAFEEKNSCVSIRGLRDSIETAKEVVILVDQNAFETAGIRKPPAEAIFQETKASPPARK